MALIYEKDGKLRECEYNYAKLGYIKTWWHFCSYRKINFMWREMIDAIGIVLIIIPALMCIPVIPFTRAYFMVRDSRIVLHQQMFRRAIHQLFAYQRCKHNEYESGTDSNEKG